MTHSKVIGWISKIWGAFSRDILGYSLIQCGLISSDTKEYHNQLKHFVQNRTLMDDLTDDDKMSDCIAFKPDSHVDLRDRHPELMDSGEDLMDIQSEDEDEV